MEENEILIKLKQIAESLMVNNPHLDSAGMDTPISDLGFDSLTLLDFVYEIQRNFNIELSPEKIIKIKTVGELVSIIKTRNI